MSSNELVLEGVKQNNLQNITIRLPHNNCIAVTGVSGSGKSSLAFDTIFAEGQWRFIESLSTYARLFLEKLDRPDVDLMRNIRPAIALEQQNPVKSSRSTVGTSTEIYDYLRLLYAKVAHPHCPRCDRRLREWNPSAIVRELREKYLNAKAIIIFESTDRSEELQKKGFHRLRRKSTSDGHEWYEAILDRLVIRDEPRLSDSIETAWQHGNNSVTVEIIDHSGKRTDVLRFQSELKCIPCNLGTVKPQPLLFSFNHPLGACAHCKGFGNTLEYSEECVIPDPDLPLARGAIEPWSKPAYRWWYRQFAKGAKKYGIDLQSPYRSLSEEGRKIIYQGASDFYGLNDFFEELENKRYKLHVRVFLSRYRKAVVCKECHGTRLRPEALAFKLDGFTIAQLSVLPVSEMNDFFKSIILTEHEQQVCLEILKQIRQKLDFLIRVGVGYLTLNREVKSLSGGEAQRINLSNQLSSKLTGTLYVMDEPTVGMHPRDVNRIAEVLRELAHAGNTVIAVEHDRNIIESADWVVELGPGGGENGGHLVYSGPRSDFLKSNTLTCRYLKNVSLIPCPRQRRKGSGQILSVSGARGHNLKDITFNIPLGTLTCVTGVSGSGKSTIVHDTIYNALARHFKIAFDTPQPFEAISGLEFLKGVKIIDQKPIGKSPRSNPITYIKAFDPIRKLFAEQQHAQALGYHSGHFSFNTAGGRCERCKGVGYQRLEMYFFEDLFVTCEECGGKRYKSEILNISYNGKNIIDILKLTVSEAIDFFTTLPTLANRLKLMESVGLGYLRLGQPATTLSGGEAQRLKICSELGVAKRRDFIYILDEPTVGLHPDDIKKLLAVLNSLVDSGNTVLVVEHNLDVIKSSDWIIDMGPEGGDDGGYIIAQGTPKEIALVRESYTGRYLAEYL